VVVSPSENRVALQEWKERAERVKEMAKVAPSVEQVAELETPSVEVATGFLGEGGTVRGALLAKGMDR
jgi:hypothetical protein